MNIDGEDDDGKVTLEIKLELTCPFCSLDVVVGLEHDSGRKCLLHSRPACEGFEVLEPLQFLAACSKGKGN